MKLSSAVKPISYVKTHAAEVVASVVREKVPVVITQRGEAKVIVQDIVTYERDRDSMAMLKIIAQSKASVARGKSSPVSKAFKSLRREILRGHQA